MRGLTGRRHWRYISSFHGPWLQLPPEVLESLAHTNYLSPRPHPIDPAVFYDLLKIRTNVDEATHLAVRAASGLSSAALNASLNSNSMLGPAAALGMGMGVGGGGGKLSRERKHRMRELATAKLSAAYHLDEIAASVATMQSASTLEDVAQLVLQRNPSDVDAKYVHFFHEKIPSRMMAQCTPLDVLDDIVAERPTDGSALRTRALTRIFKDDYANAAKDLTAALATARFLLAQHRKANAQLVLAKTAQDQYARDWRSDVKIPDDDQPSSLEAQLLFHRAGVYFTIACGHVHAALDGLKEQEEAKAARDAQIAAGEDPTPETADEVQGRLFRAESRKQVRQNAKRALRDYMAFLSHFDYTPGISAEDADDFLRRLTSQGGQNGNAQTQDALLDTPSTPTSTSEALTPYKKPPTNTPWPNLPPPTLYTVNQLFDALPPSSLPPYPSPIPPANTLTGTHESLTYHPLLTDALHSLLLCHALLQTPPKEHLRHAHNAARLLRVCDGYPIFLAARSPARSDWCEVLRRGGNWIGLGSSWDRLTRPKGETTHSTRGQGQEITRRGATTVPSQTQTQGPTQKEESRDQKLNRQKHEAILEALADDRVVDEETFQRAVRAREKRFREDERAELERASASNSIPSSGSQDSAQSSTSASASQDSAQPQAPPTQAAPSKPPRFTPKSKLNANDYPIITPRADLIARWVRDAPPVSSSSTSGSSSGPGSVNAGKKKKRRSRKDGAVGSGAGGIGAAAVE